MELEEGVKENSVIDNLPSDIEEEVGEIWKANRKFWMHLKIRENMLIQKARLKWPNDDDNSKYFHAVMKRGLRHNFLGPISMSIGLLSRVEEIKEVVFELFEAKFKESEVTRTILEGDIFKILSDEDKSSLEFLGFAVWNCDKYKSPGPTGFSILFYKKCWYLLRRM